MTAPWKGKYHGDPPVPAQRLGRFDLERLVRRSRGLIPREEIGEIFAATRNNEGLIDYLLGAWAKNPRRILRSYRGTICRLPDYPFFLPGVPLVVSRITGTVLSDSWARHRTGGLPNGIFDACAIIHELTEKKDFPRVYRIVRRDFEAFKTLLPRSEAQKQEMKMKSIQTTKERLLPYFRPFFGIRAIRRAPTARKLWKALPREIREEEFGASAWTFKDTLSALAKENQNVGPFRVIERPYVTGNRNSRFLFIER